MGLENFVQDLRFGVRMLWKSPGLTLVALGSLALGIGAVTAIFSAVDGVLISPYPYGRPNEIWAPQVLDAKNPNQTIPNCRYSEFRQLAQLPGVSMAMATEPANALLTGGRAPENFLAIRVTANAFQFLEVPTVLGRPILPSDIRPGGEAEPVIVLSYRAWQRLFSGSPSALGQTLVEHVAENLMTLINRFPSGDGSHEPVFPQVTGFGPTLQEALLLELLDHVRDRRRR